MECIDLRLRQVCDNDQYMGGLVVVCVGDFYQLRPSGGTSLCELKSTGKRLYENIFEKSVLMELKEMMRPDASASGIELMEILKLMRTLPAQGMRMFLDRVRVLSAEDREFSENALMIVCSNVERYHLNLALARRFAAARNEKLYCWTTHEGAGTIDESPEKYSIFVRGAPGVINENVAPFTNKLANGTLVELVSIVTSGTESYEADGVTYLANPPQFVRVMRKTDVRCVRKRKYAKATSQGSYQVEPGFVFTFHKVQGITIEKGKGIILDLNKRPPNIKNKLSNLTIEGVYVAMSRVKSLDQIRVSPWKFTGFEHLIKLAVRKKFPALRAAISLTKNLTYTW